MPTSEEPSLKRSLGLRMLTLYGLGTIVGGGFYALVGQVAAEAGMHTPLAFLVSALIALLSAFSFAELSARFPYSAGEAHYILEAFQRPWLSTLVGWLVIATGVVSAATLANAFAGFLQRLIVVPETLIICVMVVGLGLVAAWGVGESVLVAVIITVIEVGGLIWIVFAAGDALWALADQSQWHPLVPRASFADWSGIFLGAYLAFYSFVGFEDMVNMAEEVKQPQRNLPLAILISLGLTTLLYCCVSLVTVLAVPLDRLVQSTSPLSLTIDDERGAAAIVFVGMLAGVNGALVQIVMASRVAYGLAKKGQALAVWSRVHPVTRTPLQATLAATGCVLILALWFPLVTLAKATSTILLVVYGLVHLSLWTIKRREPRPGYDGPCYPRWLPMLGFNVSVAFLVFHTVSMWLPE